MRREEYRKPDGSWSPSRKDAQLIKPAALAEIARTVDPSVPAAWYVTVAQHESNFAANERDTEESGFQSWGLWQVSQEEAARVGRAGVDLLQPGQCLDVFSRLVHAYRMAIRAAVAIPDGDPDPPDLWAYVACAHNQGLRAALATISHYGLDWDAYARRNPTVRLVSSGYGSDCRRAALAA